MSKVINATNEDLDKLYNNSAYTILGTGGPIKEWTEGYEELLEKEGIGKPKEWYKFTGKLFNQHYNTNFFEDKLVCLAFPLDGLDTGKLAMFRLRAEDRWFNDLVDHLTNIIDDIESDDEDMD